MRHIPSYPTTLALALAAIVLVTMATSISSQPAAEQSRESDDRHSLSTQLTKEDIEGFIAQARDEHWTAERLQIYQAEATPGQSIYLACVQLIEIEREHGDPRKAILDVEKVAERSTDQQLRNAIRQLLVKVSMEFEDFKAAEAYLNKIIEESLIQQ